jgi:hypothetical protein
MARKKYRVFRVIGWIIGSLVTLILVITLGFYLGRGWIMNRAISYFNKNQPGEVKMEQMNLIPFMDFPDVVLQLRNVSFYENKEIPGALYQEPILFLNEIYLSLDVRDLVKGNLNVSQARIENGFVRLEIYEDSVLNLERALGIRFGEGKPDDTLSGGFSMQIDLKKIELTNILALLQDQTNQDRVNLKINKLESRFSYKPDHIEAGIEINLDINNVRYLTYALENEKDVRFDSRISFDPVSKIVNIEPSSLKILGLELETWGSYEFLQEPYVNLAFRATNTGLDVLNFLFLGVLNLEEIEQIGSGSIHLDGSITGSLDNQLPVVRVNGSANRIGFRINAIQKDVTDISFTMFGTNGGKEDFSEGSVEVKNFSASFPEGMLRGNIRASNLVSPEIDMVLDGDVELAGLDQMLKSDKLSDLKGHVKFEANLKGVLDPHSDEFLNNVGTLSARAEGLGIVFKQDTLSDMNGEVYMEDSIIGTRDMSLVYNGNHAIIDVKVQNLIHYLLDFERDISAQLSITSEAILPGRIIRDTVVGSLLGEKLTGLHFTAGASISKQELDAYMDHDSIPEFQFTLDSFCIELPFYADVSNMNAALTLSQDTLSLHYLKAMIGESDFSFSGRVINYESLLYQDRGGAIDLDYSLASDLMRAEDFFCYREEFLLPESYRTEYLADFHLDGSLRLPVDGLVNDSIELDMGLNIRDLGWKFRYYPLAFNNFHLQARKEGNELIIDEFQGEVGDNNLKMSALLGNFTDTLRQNLYGNIVLESDLLDFNELVNYRLPGELKDTTMADTAVRSEPVRLDQIEYPDFDFQVDIGEFRYDSYNITGMKGKMRSTSDKILYLDSLVTSGGTVGKIDFQGQFNVSNPYIYNLSAEFDLEEMKVSDLDIKMQSGEEVYTLKENFRGLVSADGMAEVFITPDLKVDMSTTTAMFNFQIDDGALINFTPLQAASKYLDGKNLDNVRFGKLRNSFPLTLVDSRILIPLTIVESTAGQMLIEGEQGLDGRFLYLLRLPTALVKGAAASVIGNTDDREEDQIMRYESGKFLVLTVYGDGENTDVKPGDKRDKYPQ